MKKLLLIDDDLNYLEHFKKSFQIFFNIDYRENSRDIDLNSINQYDALVIDYKMPQEDGLLFFDRLKNSIQQTPPSFLITNYDDQDLRILSLKLGMNDILPKEMSDQEILLRIEKSFRTNAIQEVFKKGNLSANLLQRTISINDQSITVTATELHILWLMCSKEIITKQTLLDQVWNKQTIVPQTLNTHIYNLNKKLGDWDHLITIGRDSSIYLTAKK